MRLSDITDFFQNGIWRIRVQGLPPARALGVRALRIIVLAALRFRLDECPRKASALTYYSLLSLVPVIAMAFGIAKGFGLEKMIENQILQAAQNANWQADVATRVIAFSNSLLDQARGGVIAGVGVVLLFWTVISILGNIEEAFNAIWEVRRPRSLLRKVSDYLSLMVLSPILIILSSSLTVVVASHAKILIQKVGLFGPFSSVILFVLNLLPYVSIWVLLTVLYVAMPNTRVPFRAGIVAGILTGTIFQAVQWVYITFQVGVAGYGAIYGTFAAIPLFLAWLQLSWNIVLFGAEVAYACENEETYGYPPALERLGAASERFLLLRVFHLLVGAFHRGEGPLTARAVSERLEIPVRLVRRLLHELVAVPLVAETVREGHGEAAFQPARSVESLTVQEVLELLDRRGTAVPPAGTEEGARIARVLDDLEEALRKGPGGLLLKEI